MLVSLSQAQPSLARLRIASAIEYIRRSGQIRFDVAAGNSGEMKVPSGTIASVTWQIPWLTRSSGWRVRKCEPTSFS